MLYESANCKLKVSRCRQEDAAPERPLKLKHEISSLDELVRELHAVFSSPRVNVEHVNQLMMGYNSDARHWRKYAKFDRFRYTRNLVDSGNGQFNVMVLCWGPGHASAIHDHADSHCFMKILSGELEEIRYDWPERVEQCGRGVCQSHCDCAEVKQMKEIGRTRLEENDVCYINDTLGLHRVANPSHVEGAVSLHLYSPPFDSCRVFDARTGRATTATTTFWSVGGKRVNKVNQEN